MSLSARWTRRSERACASGYGKYTTGLTTVFVTHDQAEAMDVADRVAILNAGRRIEQVGALAELRERPATPFVQAFLN